MLGVLSATYRRDISVFASSPDGFPSLSTPARTRLPSENSSGNWVKVVQRLQARVAFDSSEYISTIRAGMSTNVSIDTNHKRKLSDLF